MSTVINKAPKFKAFVYDARGYAKSTMEADLAAWGVAAARHTLLYDTGTVIFVVGEIVSGATGVAVVTGLEVGSDATSGTLFLDVTTDGFVGGEVLTGSIAGAASVQLAASAVAIPLTIGSVRVSTNEECIVACVSYSDQEQS